MKRSIWLGIALSVLVSLILVTCEAPYSNPSATFQDSDLVGTWEAHYWEGDIDRLIIRPDGTFKQIYRKSDYAYETPWNKWWVERLSDGRGRVHLEGARYYLDGIEWGEQEGMYPPYSPAQLPAWPIAFKDPFGGELLEMVGKLILNVRRLSSGELILHHMWHPGDGAAFAIIGGEREMFRRVETP